MGQIRTNIEHCFLGYYIAATMAGRQRAFMGVLDPCQNLDAMAGQIAGTKKAPAFDRGLIALVMLGLSRLALFLMQRHKCYPCVRYRLIFPQRFKLLFCLYMILEKKRLISTIFLVNHNNSDNG
jgi:hypothetical protein